MVFNAKWAFFIQLRYDENKLSLCLLFLSLQCLYFFDFPFVIIPLLLSNCSYFICDDDDVCFTNSPNCNETTVHRQIGSTIRTHYSDCESTSFGSDSLMLCVVEKQQNQLSNVFVLSDHGSYNELMQLMTITRTIKKHSLFDNVVKINII